MALAVLAVCAIFSAPAAAQVSDDRWFLRADVGPSFGTFGATPVVNASTGVKLWDRVGVAAEFGALPRASFDKASGVAPAIPTVLVPRDDVHVNNYHANANLLVRPGNWGVVRPYLTGGYGAFVGSTVARGTLGDTSLTLHSRDTNPATNLGGGVRYNLTKWLGVNADYRHFIVHADDTRHVNRFGVGITFDVK
jgi:opacity protein-like surface antigen